jgi:hypothetical protein
MLPVGIPLIIDEILLNISLELYHILKPGRSQFELVGDWVGIIEYALDFTRMTH